MSSHCRRGIAGAGGHGRRKRRYVPQRHGHRRGGAEAAPPPSGGAGIGDGCLTENDAPCDTRDLLPLLTTFSPPPLEVDIDSAVNAFHRNMIRAALKRVLDTRGQLVRDIARLRDAGLDSEDAGTVRTANQLAFLLDMRVWHVAPPGHGLVSGGVGGGE